MPERIQLRRTKGWRMPPNTVKVDRSTRWGNGAAKIGEDISYYTQGCVSATASDVVDLFRRFMAAHEAADKRAFDAWLSPLRGKNLACWCSITAPDSYVPCHADVLLSIANDIPLEEVIRENYRRAKGEALQ